MTKYNLSITNHSLSVHNESETVLATHYTPLLNFLNKIINPSFLSSSTGIMPPGVLSVNESIIVYERPPQFQNIQVIPQIVDSINYDNDDMRIYRLPIPWQLYICTYSVFNGRYYSNSVRMFFMNSSLTNSDIQNHRIYLAPLPNFYTSGLLCNPMFASMEDIERYDNDVSGVIQASYDWIWNTGTNLDLTMTIVEAFYQLPKITQSGLPTLFNKISQRYHDAVSFSSYYLPFNYVDLLFRIWETYQLHEISDLVWPNASSSDRVAITARDAERNYLSLYYADRGIDPSTVSQFSYSSCEDEDCEDCESENYPYDRDDYLKYVRDRLSNVTTFQHAYNQTLASLTDNSSPQSNRLQNSIQEIYLKTLDWT